MGKPSAFTKLFNASRQTGVSLLELVVVIAILGIALTAIISSIGAGLEKNARSYDYVKTAALAQLFLDEIYGRRFDENTTVGGIPACWTADAQRPNCSTIMGTDAGEALGVGNERSTFDDVDDYNIITSLVPGDIDGAGQYANYQVSVDVIYINATTDAFGLAQEDAKVITVTITTPEGDQVPFSVYRANF